MFHTSEDEEHFLVKHLVTRKKELEEELLILESKHYYDKLRERDIDSSLVQTYQKQDEEMLMYALEFKNTFNAQRSTFFGYPGNLTADSPLVRRLRKEEAEMFYINNCGDPYEEGNLSSNGKEYERKILNLFYAKFNVDANVGWGYITSGGTESNTWGIRNGFRKYPDGRLYFCEAAHYSVEKSVSNGNDEIFPYTIIPKQGPKSEKIDTEKLLSEIQLQFDTYGEPAVLLLTWGTTKMGSLDEISIITNDLKKLDIPFYVHVDAAFFGGIPNNQKNAPVCPGMDKLGVDSISVSFHKFFGMPGINSIVIAKEKASGKEIDYLGQTDTTISGSRTFPVFSAYQRIREMLERSPEDYYCANVIYTTNEMKKNGLKYLVDGESNIFVIPCPSDVILKKYQLPSFEGSDGKISLAHFIINPFHTMHEIDDLISDLAEDQKMDNREISNLVEFDES